jgi:hydroxyacylglutathione hydrolase
LNEENMIFDIIVVGPLAVNCFLLGDEGSRDGIVVDPGGDAEKVLAAVRSHGLTVRRVINTHGHFDHIGANRQVLAATGAELLVHREDTPFLSRAAEVAVMYGLSTENSPPPDRFLEDGMVIGLGETEIKVLHTPGHTPGGCCLYLAAEGKVITGDTLFADGVGRTDFPGSSHEALMTSIRTKLMTLPDAVAAYPGHGPATTIGHERRYNQYLGG